MAGVEEVSNVNIERVDFTKWFDIINSKNIINYIM